MGGGAPTARKQEWAEPSLPKTEELTEVSEAEGIFSAENRAQLADKSWSVRFEAVQAVCTMVRDMPLERRTPLLAEVICWHLATAAQDKNMQVQNKLLEGLQAVCTSFELVGRRTVARLLPLAVEKLGAKQTKAAAVEALFMVGEACSPSWAMQQVRDLVLQQKNPKVMFEALSWATECIDAFGVASVSVSEPAEFALGALDHREVSVRDAAMGLLVAMCRAVGPKLLSSPLLKNLKDDPRKRLAAESDKLGEALAAPQPSRFFKHGAAKQSAVIGGNGGAVGATVPASVLEESFPRADLMEVLKGDVLKRLKDTNWKERHAALQIVQKALKDYPRLAPGVGALIEALRPRLKDHQVVLSVGAIQALGLLAQGVGRHIKVHIKAVVPDLLTTLGDGKSQIRDAAMEALER